MTVLGAPYPIVSTPLGLLPSVSDATVIKADLMQLLLTNPGERVMLPAFGTPLREILFEQNNAITIERVRQAIIGAIAYWEPRIVVTDVIVTNSKNEKDTQAYISDINSNSLYVQINFLLPDQINAQESLVLQIPLGD
jgi:phage baseplate assembly protein W